MNEKQMTIYRALTADLNCNMRCEKQLRLRTSTELTHNFFETFFVLVRAGENLTNLLQ